MRASEFTFNSCTAKNKIFTRLYEPDTPPVAVLQIAHGMAEHSALYKPFCEYMAQRGMVVAVNDHLGHGRSVASGALYGHFGDRGGLYNVVEDVRNLQSILREKYPDLPYFLMGHSMGSFVAREFAAAYGASLTAAVFMGTSAGIPEGVWRAERAYLEMLKKSKGPRAKLPYLAQIVTGPYNRKFKPNRTDFDWVTSKEEEVDRFVNDPLCGFPLTVQGYIDLGALLHAVNTDEWYRRLPKKLPVYLISGENDPVGGMGKGVRKIEKKLRETGHDVTMTLYPHVRHALVTEVNADRVFEDVYAFLAAHLPKLSGSLFVACAAVTAGALRAESGSVPPWAPASKRRRSGLPSRPRAYRPPASGCVLRRLFPHRAGRDRRQGWRLRHPPGRPAGRGPRLPERESQRRMQPSCRRPPAQAPTARTGAFETVFSWDDRLSVFYVYSIPCARGRVKEGPAAGKENS